LRYSDFITRPQRFTVPADKELVQRDLDNIFTQNTYKLAQLENKELDDDQDCMQYVEYIDYKQHSRLFWSF
jgi:hypothetical protein